MLVRGDVIVKDCLSQIEQIADRSVKIKNASQQGENRDDILEGENFLVLPNQK
jgi:hypothetical protein